MSAGTTFWTEEKLLELRGFIERHVQESGAVRWEELGAHFGTTASGTWQTYGRIAPARGWPRVAELRRNFRVVGPAPESPTPVDLVEQARERRENLANVRVERELLEAVAGEKSLRATLERLASATAAAFPAPPKYVAPKFEKGATTETVIQVFSDWHGGEVVKPAAVRGFNEFNLPILAQRVKRIVDAHLSIKARMEKGGGWRFRRLVVASIGDMVSGTIHELEKHSSPANIVLIVHAVAYLLAQAIRDLGAQYEVVDVYTVAGNHSRLPDSRRVGSKDALRNWDALIGLMVEAHLRDMTHVNFILPDAYAVACQIEGWNFLLTHGDTVKSWNSIPFYGLGRLVGNLQALEAGRGQTIHAALFGHFHNASSIELGAAETFVNGSVIAATEFSVNTLGRADSPKQWMLMVHEAHRITSRWPLRGECSADSPAYALPRIVLDAL